MAETPHFLKALGRQPLPGQIDVEGQAYRLERVFKNDFFAVTALYVRAIGGEGLSREHASTLTPGPLPGRERGGPNDPCIVSAQNVSTLTPAPLPERERGSRSDPEAWSPQPTRTPHKVILKVSRRASLFGLPMQWVGRILAAKERAALLKLQDLPGIPRLVGEWGPTGIVREFIEGRHLSKGMYVGDEFHPQLRALIGQIHQRGMAYVDLEKAENVLVGVDGRPYLFDFQIAWYLPRRWGGELLPTRLIRRWLQRGDLYHLVKLQRRTRPDQLTAEALAASYRKPLIVRVYRVISYPFTWARRRVLQWIDPRRAPGERGRVMGDFP